MLSVDHSFSRARIGVGVFGGLGILGNYWCHREMAPCCAYCRMLSEVSLNFVEGRRVDGEILETLWSGLDEVSGLTQAMSIAHHQEVLDEYMNYSNWTKIIWIVGIFKHASTYLTKIICR